VPTGGPSDGRGGAQRPTPWVPLGLVSGIVGMAFGAGSAVAGKSVLASVLAAIAAVAALGAGYAVRELAAMLTATQGSQAAPAAPHARATGPFADLGEPPRDGLFRPVPPPTPPPVDSGAGEAVDVATGLYTHPFFRAALKAHVAASRRHLRPVTVVLLDVVDERGDRAVAAEVARLLQATLRECDVACLLDNGRYGVVMEDTPESGGEQAIARLRAESGDPKTRWHAGIACYPNHAFGVGELMDRAELALHEALQSVRSSTVVASVD
jgi:GGDEF domain-containing protein